MINVISAQAPAPKLAELARKLKKALPEEALEIYLAPHECASMSNLRQQYQKGLAAWLRKDQPHDALCLMQQALENVMCCLPQDQCRQLWWLSCGLFDVLILDEHVLVEAAPRLLAAIDRQLKLLMNQEHDPSDDLAAQLLYVLDRTRAVCARISSIKRHYQLDEPIFDVLDDELMPIFLQEADELYPQIRSTLLAGINSPLSSEAIYKVQRWLHTLKGSARMAGAMVSGHLVHQMESILLNYGAQQAQQIWDDLLHELDELAQQLAQLKQKYSEADLNVALPQKLSDLSARLAYLAEQVAKSLDKQVTLHIDDTQANLPACYISPLIAPLEHLTRNAVVHGIEPCNQRTEAQKNSVGEITIRAVQQESGWLLSFIDDGAGLLLPRIRQKAIQKHIIEANEVLSDNDLAQLIFLPGLSTSQQISELAGRGIGLDVVASEIQQLGGSVTVHSKPGRATQFDIYLPQILP